MSCNTNNILKLVYDDGTPYTRRPSKSAEGRAAEKQRSEQKERDEREAIAKRAVTDAEAAKQAAHLATVTNLASYALATAERPQQSFDPEAATMQTEVLSPTKLMPENEALYGELAAHNRANIALAQAAAAAATQQQ